MHLVASRVIGITEPTRSEIKEGSESLGHIYLEQRVE